MDSDMDDVLENIAKYCIEHKLYRNGNIFTPITKKLLKEFNAPSFISGGYMFLDKPYETSEKDLVSGMIRLYDHDTGNPKWVFWIEKETPEEIKIEWA